MLKSICFIIFLLDLLTFCQNEHEKKTKIREDQAEGRKLRLDEKKAMVDRLAHPAQPIQAKPDKKSKQLKSKQLSQQSGGRGKKIEPEPEPVPLPYLPTPDEIILQKEGINYKAN